MVHKQPRDAPNGMPMTGDAQMLKHTLPTDADYVTGTHLHVYICIGVCVYVRVDVYVCVCEIFRCGTVAASPASMTWTNATDACLNSITIY